MDNYLDWIYCNDYKFVHHTNPALYPNFEVSPNELINVDFHWGAHRIICQTQFQKDIYDRNLNRPHKTINFSGNLWSEESLDLLESHCDKEKNDRAVVIDSPYPQKGTQASAEFCKDKQWNFDIIKDPNYESFLNKLSSYSKLVFHPTTPETCCRLILEAKMMNVEVVTNKLIGASYEDWYCLNGKDLINKMRHKRETFADFISQIRFE